MLYKFYTRRCFADQPTHCGIIEARTIREAVKYFIHWNSLHWDNEELPLANPDPTIEVETEVRATVTYESTWASVGELAPGTSASTGEDIYVIQHFDQGPVFSMLAEEWNEAFRS